MMKEQQKEFENDSQTNMDRFANQLGFAVLNKVSAYIQANGGINRIGESSSYEKHLQALCYLANTKLFSTVETFVWANEGITDLYFVLEYKGDLCWKWTFSRIVMCLKEQNGRYYFTFDIGVVPMSHSLTEDDDALLFYAKQMEAENATHMLMEKHFM